MTSRFPLVKICSLREPAHAEFAVAAGADAIGLIFAEARRKVTMERAVEIVSELRRTQGSKDVVVVGVFVGQSADEINRIADLVELDVAQLHGDESPELAALVERPVIKALRLAATDTAPGVASRVEAFDRLARPPLAYLVDPHSTDAPGGTGRRVDWTVAEEIARSTRMILAGGLTPGNVGDAIRRVRPAGVDVSSGVETDGVKDRAKVIAFVHAARAAFSTLDLDQGGVVPITEAAEPADRP